MATKCKALDLVLYCTRMDDTRIRDEDYETIKTLTRAFGEAIWENAVFTLTFANKVKKAVRSQSQTPVDQKEFFQSRLSQWESKLKEALEIAGVCPETVSKTVVVPVGYQDDLCLPDRDDWLSEFWLTCLRQINKRATLALLKISVGRLPEEGGPLGTDINDLNVSGDDLKVVLTDIATVYGVAAAGALVGSVAGPPGVAIGSAVGMFAGLVPFVIHTIKQETKQKTQ